MKVLFTVGYPLSWSKGGFTVQIESTKKALENQGVTVDWVDFSGEASQQADIIHYWGPPSSEYMWNAAQAAGIKQVMTFLAPRGLFRPDIKQYAGRLVRHALLKGIGEARLFGRMGIGMGNADAYIFLNNAEQQYAHFMYGWPFSRGHVIPAGVDECFFSDAGSSEVLDGLLYPSYICPRKNQVEIAQIAKQERIRVFFIGGAQGESPDYMERFKREIDNHYAVWLGEVTDRQRLAALYRSSLGTFLASDYDNQGIVLLEALACEKPAMGPGLPSLKSYFGDHIHYCPSAKTKGFASSLKQFDAFCRAGGRQTMDVLNWADVGQKILTVYRSLLS